MKLLILTCATGGGHNSAARAIAQAARERGAECAVVDALRFLPGIDGKVISHGHTFIYRHLPKLFGVGYRYEQRGGARAFRVECARGARSLGRYISESDFDAVITVHAFAGFMLSRLRAKGMLPIPAAFVATDYTCSPGVADIGLDLTFIPRGLTGEFVSCGVPREAIVETGIPVCREYGERVSREEARAQLALPQEGELILLMCGSMGCGPMEELAEELLEAAPGAIVAVFCGTNKRLMESMSAHSSERLRVVGFTRKVGLWMDAAELIISKPGGLTSSETMAKRLPMIILDAVPGVETKNLEHLTALGCAETASVQEIPALAARLLASPERRSEISANMERYFPHGSAPLIAERMLELAGEKQVR